MKPYTAWSADGRSVVVLDEVHPNMLVDGWARWTDKDTEAMLRFRAKGWTHQRIAAALNFSEPQIQKKLSEIGGPLTTAGGVDAAPISPVASAPPHASRKLGAGSGPARPQSFSGER